MSRAAARRSPPSTASARDDEAPSLIRDPGRVPHPPRWAPTGKAGLRPTRSQGLPRGREDLARDHHLLDLVGPLADLGQLGVAQVALDVELARVAVSPVDLHGGVA